MIELYWKWPLSIKIKLRFISNNKAEWIALVHFGLFIDLDIELLWWDEVSFWFGTCCRWWNSRGRPLGSIRSLPRTVQRKKTFKSLCRSPQPVRSSDVGCGGRSVTKIGLKRRPIWARSKEW
jgi:hypothetical protein